MNTFARLSVSALLLLSVACDDEAGQDNHPLPEREEGQRREVLLTLKNQLVVPQGGTKAAGEAAGTPAGTTGTTETAETTGNGVATKADTPIATTAENYIRSLDVYVFGSETVDGDYTFQELFYYRDNAAVVPGDWAHGINLTAATGGDNATTALMKLTKGLYVKIYCVANREQLYGTAADGTVAPYTDYQPLEQSAPGQDNNTVRAGVPTETDFLRLHTKPIDPAAATPTGDDILVTPLPMAGAYTTALDLTDFSVSARTQVGFKLTRAVSRFDIANDAATSKFTITGISMAQARPGASLFPIRVLGSLPAVDGELITTPTRTFTGDKANNGLQTGAFYSYASPTEDAGYLILKGTYAVNQSENQEVSYQIPFKPEGDAEGHFLEITHNQRYTIAITKADAFRLDFTMTVADWNDDGSIDDYNPGGDNTGASATVDINVDPNKKVTYDETTRQITIPILSTAKFELTATAGHTLTKTYTGGPSVQQYDWLEVSAPAEVTKAATAQRYTFTIKGGYAGGKYPDAIVKVKDENSGETQTFKVITERVKVPAVVNVSIDPDKKNAYDETTRVVTMYLSQGTRFEVTTDADYTLAKTYSGSSTAQQQDWLVMSAPVESGTSLTYRFSAKSDYDYVSNEYPGVTLQIDGKINEDKQLLTIVPKMVAPILAATTYTLAADANTAIPYIDIKATGFGGSVISGPDWLTYDKVNSDATVTTYRVSLDPNKQGIAFPGDLPADQTITVANKKDGTLTANATVSFTDVARAETDLLGYDVKETDDDSYRVKTTGKTISLVTYSMFKPNITTAYADGYGSGNNWLPAPASPSKTELVNNRHKYTYSIVIPAATGTDATYQLHKGTVTVKNGATTVKTYTVWRGVSNKPYLTNNPDNPYYTAIKKGSYWWAPVNCGAKRIAKNGSTDTVDGIGNLYQWGRKDPTNFGSTAAQGPQSSSSPNNNIFYRNNNSPNDWLSPKNDNLWQNGLNDPCPDGYRVPTLDELKTLGSGTFGGGLLKITADSSYPDLVLPAAGLKDGRDASEYSKGTIGYYWSSTVSGTNACHAHFTDGTALGASDNYRAYGFFVRCIRK